MSGPRKGTTPPFGKIKIIIPNGGVFLAEPGEVPSSPGRPGGGQ
jgi:hypothetical protein